MKRGFYAAMIVFAFIVIFEIARIDHELEAIHYQLTLSNCLSMAEDGVLCGAAKSRTATRSPKGPLL